MNNREKEKKIAQCTAYFTENPQYDRVFNAMRKKWRQYGHIAGRIKIENPTKMERQALEGLFAKEFPETVIRFSMADFEAVLQQTRFRGVTLEELLSAYFQEELITNQEEKKLNALKKRQFVQGLKDQAVLAYGSQSPSAVWLDRVTDQKKYGHRMILAEYAKDPETAKKQVENVCQALEILSEKKGIPLAVLGSEVTRNPHEFDRNTISGRLLIHGLSCINNDMACKSAEDILMLYYASGIKPDDISSFTTVYGIHFYTDKGEHPAYRGFIEMGEPFVVTLSNLSRIKSVGVAEEHAEKKVYVIENQMVFSYLCESLQGQEAALVCTSGQLKTASWMLLDMLSEIGCRLFYCGDLDPEGIGIAEKVLTRNEGCAQLWHMSKSDYLISVSEEDISEESLRKLENITHPALAEVKDMMRKRKKPGYQERLIGMLLEDITMHRGVFGTCIRAMDELTLQNTDKQEDERM